jgi:hypothetical protein
MVPLSARSMRDMHELAGCAAPAWAPVVPHAAAARCVAALKGDASRFVDSACSGGGSLESADVRFTDASMEQILRLLRCNAGLVSVSLGHVGPHVLDFEWAGDDVWLPHLEFLCIKFAHVRNINRLLSRAPRLERLHLMCMRAPIDVDPPPRLRALRVSYLPCGAPRDPPAAIGASTVDLGVSGAPCVTDAYVRSLPGALESLRVVRTGVGAAGFEHAVRAMPRLHTLCVDLCVIRFRSPPGILARHESLRCLSMARCALRDSDLAVAIGCAPALQELDISFNVLLTSDGVRRVRSLGCIRTWVLRGLEEEHGDAIADVIRSCPSLERVTCAEAASQALRERARALRADVLVAPA